jgi:hypothetical protein
MIHGKLKTKSLFSHYLQKKSLDLVHLYMLSGPKPILVQKTLSTRARVCTLLDSYICFLQKYDKVYILEGERKNISPGQIFLVQIRPRKPHVTRVQPPNKLQNQDLPTKTKHNFSPRRQPETIHSHKTPNKHAQETMSSTIKRPTTTYMMSFSLSSKHNQVIDFLKGYSSSNLYLETK